MVHFLSSSSQTLVIGRIDCGKEQILALFDWRGNYNTLATRMCCLSLGWGGCVTPPLPLYYNKKKKELQKVRVELRGRSWIEGVWREWIKEESYRERDWDRVLSVTFNYTEASGDCTHSCVCWCQYAQKKKKKRLTRFLFMQNASCTGVNRVCHLLEGKAIDAVFSICHLIMPDSRALFKLTAERS